MICSRCKQAVTIVWLSRSWIEQNRRKWWEFQRGRVYYLADGEYVCECCFEEEARQTCKAAA